MIAALQEYGPAIALAGTAAEAMHIRDRIDLFEQHIRDCQVRKAGRQIGAIGLDIARRGFRQCAAEFTRKQIATGHCASAPVHRI